MVALDTNSTCIYNRECNHAAHTHNQQRCKQLVQVKVSNSEASTDIQQTESILYKPVAYPGILFGGGVQQIQLRTEDRENGDLGAVAP